MAAGSSFLMQEYSQEDSGLHCCLLWSCPNCRPHLVMVVGLLLRPDQTDLKTLGPKNGAWSSWLGLYSRLPSTLAIENRMSLRMLMSVSLSESHHNSLPSQGRLNGRGGGTAGGHQPHHYLLTPEVSCHRHIFSSQFSCSYHCL